MKRLQIYIEEELDQVLETRARHERRSKAALIREAVRREFVPSKPTPDPFADWIGGGEAGPADIDEVVYGG